MASRLYATTRALFAKVVAQLGTLKIQRVVSPTSAALIALYLTGLILLERRQTPWRMQEGLPARCHDALNRLLRTIPLSTRALMACLVAWSKSTGGIGHLCLDDVVVEKAFSRLCAWTGWTYSFAQKRKVWGLHGCAGAPDIVVLCWCYGFWRIPVAFRLWRPKAACSPRRYRTKLELAKDMLCDVLALGLPCSFDTQYTAGWFTKFLQGCGVTWVGTLPPKTSVYYQNKRWAVRYLCAFLKLRGRSHLGLRAGSVWVYAPKYGHLRLVVTRNRHGNYEAIVSNERGADLTMIVDRKRSRWSIETVFRDSKQFSGLCACQCRVDAAWVRHVALVLLTFVVLQKLRRCPEETLGAVKERLQLEVMHGNVVPPAPLKARAALL